MSGMSTEDVGWLASFTVNVADPPFSTRFPLIAEMRNPGVSSSRLESITSGGLRPAYSGAAVLLLLSSTIRNAEFPSEMLSSTPVTRTACSECQFVLVSVSADGLTVASDVLSELTETTTLPVGWLVRRTVKSAWPPSSVTDPLTELTKNPALSSSWVAAATSCGSRPRYPLVSKVLLSAPRFT